jgi:hypothetical protein
MLLGMTQHLAHNGHPYLCVRLFLITTSPYIWTVGYPTFNYLTILEVGDTVHLCSMNKRKTNLMQLLYIFIVAVGDPLHVSGVFTHHQERQKTKPVA